MYHNHQQPYHFLLLLVITSLLLLISPSMYTTNADGLLPVPDDINTRGENPCIDGSYASIIRHFILPVIEARYSWTIQKDHIWGVRRREARYAGSVFLTISKQNDPNNIYEATCIFNVSVPVLGIPCYKFSVLNCQVDGLAVPDSGPPVFCNQASFVNEPQKCTGMKSQMIIDGIIVRETEKKYEAKVVKYTDRGYYDVPVPCHFYFGNVWLTLDNGQDKKCDYGVYVYGNMQYDSVAIRCWK